MSTQADRYAEALSPEARERQERLAKERYVCCGTLKTDGHHALCHLRPDDPPPAVPEEQTSLL